MAASSRARVLDLYRAMLRESKQFSAYNYRTYAIRKIRDAFRENKNMKDPVEIQALVNKAKRDLEMIRRQRWWRPEPQDGGAQSPQPRQGGGPGHSARLPPESTSPLSPTATQGQPEAQASLRWRLPSRPEPA
ncbi:LYR motif-containing protein 4 [Myotis brandtii]|uniref:LYR motif-containing protein 4 n=1 Tax=Myotis brandtii TaxID=109478 RepID=S7N1C4_MYOBR|nr:LYR motif-containing protein 4 [Myotis brandtii]